MPSSVTFKDLLYKVDNDINTIRKGRGADGLDYTVKIDGRETNVIARSTFTRQNVISFLVTFELGGGHVVVYLSDIDIAQILSRLNGELYTNIRSFFKGIYDGSKRRSRHTILLERGELATGIASAALSSTKGFFAIPTLRTDEMITTHLGFKIKYGDFCDAVSLIVSKEGNADIGQLVGKLSILANQLRAGSYKVSLGRGYVAGLKTVDDIEEAYKDAVTHKRAKERDAELFIPELLERYFQSFE